MARRYEAAPSATLLPLWRGGTPRIAPQQMAPTSRPASGLRLPIQRPSDTAPPPFQKRVDSGSHVPQLRRNVVFGPIPPVGCLGAPDRPPGSCLPRGHLSSRPRDGASCGHPAPPLPPSRRAMTVERMSRGCEQTRSVTPQSPWSDGAPRTTPRRPHPFSPPVPPAIAGAICCRALGTLGTRAGIAPVPGGGRGLRPPCLRRLHRNCAARQSVGHGTPTEQAASNPAPAPP